MRRVAALGALLAAGAACVSLDPRPDPTRFWVLEAEAPPAPARPPLELLGVGPVRLPAYLDRPQLVTRAGAGRVEVASADRWAAPLDGLFAGALADQLRGAVPARQVIAWPWPAGAAPQWTVSVEVLRFEGDADGSAVLEARWTVRGAGGAERQGLTLARERPAAPGVAGTVPALGRAIGALAREVAAALDEARARGGG